MKTLTEVVDIVGLKRRAIQIMDCIYMPQIGKISFECLTNKMKLAILRK